MSSSTQPDYKETYDEARARGYAEGCWIKGYEDGWAKGYDKGYTNVAAKLLIHHLEYRFGVLPPSVQQDILAADAKSLDAWVDVALKALDLQAIFGSA